MGLYKNYYRRKRRRLCNGLRLKEALAGPLAAINYAKLDKRLPTSKLSTSLLGRIRNYASYSATPKSSIYLEAAGIKKTTHETID